MIGFGISCCDRKSYTMECLEAVWKFMPEDGVLVIGDDASMDGTIDAITQWVEALPFEQACKMIHSRLSVLPQDVRVGISRNKKAITDMLLEAWPKIDDIILIEDDVVPLKPEWWKRFTDTAHANGEAHLMYLPSAAGLMHGPTRKVTGTPPTQIEWKGYCSAMVFYVRAALLREVGSFDPRFNAYGFEHNDLSARLLARQGHDPHGVYPHCVAAERESLFACKDVMAQSGGPTVVSTTLGDKVKIARQNEHLYRKSLSNCRIEFAYAKRVPEPERDRRRRVKYFAVT